MPAETIMMENGSEVSPVATFLYGKDDSYHGAIVKDDGCYVVCIANIVDGENVSYKWSTHVFKEAFEAMRELPLPGG